jgi:hypothetical protein
VAAASSWWIQPSRPPGETDIVPTLADLSGLRVPSPIDGVIASSGAVTTRGNVKDFLQVAEQVRAQS